MVRRSLSAVLFASVVLATPAFGADSVRKLVLTHNYKKAAAVLLAQAKAGKADAQYQLGVFYRSGIGLQRDEDKAIFWLSKAANAGVADAQAILLRMGNVTRTDAKRDGVMPSGGTAPTLPLLSAQHLPERGGILAPWLVEATARGLQKPVGLADPVDVRDEAGQTPLLVAARLNQDETVRSLLAQGADPALADKNGWTAVMWAARNGNAAMIAALFGAGAQAGAKTKGGFTASDIAAQSCQLKVLPALVQGGEAGDARFAAGRCSDWLQSAQQPAGTMRLALQVGSPMDVESAIALDGASINKEDQDGFTPLHAAAARGDAKLVSLLVNANANANAVAKDGSTPLMLAAAKGCLDCVQRLLPYADDINAKNVDGESALYLAVRARSIPVVKELRQAGASEASRTIGRDTPEKLATRLADENLLTAVME